MKSMKRLALLVALALAIMALSGCGSKNVSYKDGTYEGQSSVYEGDEEGNGDGYGVVSITLKDNRIVACEFTTYETDGTLKDEEYGKARGSVANKDYYNKAQKAVAGAKEYARQLAEVGELDKVDAISGATINYGQFKEAVQEALKKARQE
ncbi:MAG: FMN-binding protein [Clostridia bacterium]|nr:FMN-binding protein [Clostridia bacterium]